MLLLAVITSTTWAICRGGSLRNLAALKLRLGWAGAAALLIQIVLQRAGAWGWAWARPLAPWLHVASYLLLLAAVYANLSVPGVKMLGLGLLLNFLVIAANGGKMPVQAALMPATGVPVGTPLRRLSNTHTFLGPATRLPWLADIFVVPAPPPLKTSLASTGDFLIALGLGATIYFALRGPQPARVGPG